jgi:hypothetical protein
MRISHAVTFVAALSLGVSSFAVAAPSSQPSSVLVNGSPQAPHKLTPDEAQGMAGTFQLDDGRLLVLTSKRSTLFAEFDGKREELVPAGQNRFVSRDSGARLTFDQVPFGTEVVLDQGK